MLITVGSVLWFALSRLPSAGANGPAALARTSDGHPDLHGVWNYGTITPLERPPALAGKPVFTEQEAAAFERGQLGGRDIPDRWDAGLRVVPDKRTSLIVNPSDGRLPALTPDGRARADALAERSRRPAATPEDRGPRERCLARSGPPILPDAYSNVVQIFQTSTDVVLLTELIHDARVVALDGRPHIPSTIRQWMGDSRGRWDGDTLVVETTNYTDKINFRGAGAGLRVTERFSEVDANTLSYEFTVEDPTTWVMRWTAVMPLIRTTDQIIEYACHEGNLTNMSGILAGARLEERTTGVTPSRPNGRRP